MVLVFSIGFIFFLTLSFLLRGEHSNYVVALDGVSYLTQAKIFLTGHINVSSHKLKEFFTTGYCINDGKFYSKYFPGWPMILSIGLALGKPWAINPILGLLTLIIIYLLGKEIYNNETGLCAAVLLLFSYEYYIFTPTYTSHPSALFFSSLFFYLMVKTIKEQKMLTASLAGLSLGITFLIRPYSAVAISLPIMVYFFCSSVFGKKRNLAPFVTVVSTFIPLLFLQIMYNYFQTGSIFLTPFQYYNPFDTLGFGLRSSDVFLEPSPYTLFDGLRNIAINLGLLNY